LEVIVTTPFWCLFIACLIPNFLAPVAARYKAQQFGTLDNNNPRAQTAALEGTGARAVAAQMNAWEALAIFTAAVTVNHLSGGDPGTSAILAMVWVGARILHAVFYVTDIAAARSAAFAVAFFSAIGLFFV
jgi:uncharacterized MAPEG superfamily protein